MFPSAPRLAAKRPAFSSKHSRCSRHASVGDCVFLGIELNELRNGKTGVVSTDASPATLRVIRADEEQVIAQSTCRVLGLSAARV
jgi:acetate kinase